MWLNISSASHPVLVNFHHRARDFNLKQNIVSFFLLFPPEKYQITHDYSYYKTEEYFQSLRA